MLNHEVGDKPGIAEVLEAIAGAKAAHAEAERAARLYGAAEAMREATGTPIPVTDRIRYDRLLAKARAQLEEAIWQAAWNKGRAMPLERAIAYALEA